jgi:hypothetical protein
MVYFNTYGNDKADLALLNKDYSIKMQEYIEEAKYQVNKRSDKPKNFLEQIKNKLKEKKK